MLKCNEMTQFMNQRDQKCIFVQASIYTDPVMIFTGGVPVIPQHAFSGARNGQVYFIGMQVFKYLGR